MQTLKEIQETIETLLPGSKICFDRENFDEIVIRTQRTEPTNGQQLQRVSDVAKLYEFLDEENPERVQLSITISVPTGPDAHKSAWESLSELWEQNSLSMSSFNIQTI